MTIKFSGKVLSALKKLSALKEKDELTVLQQAIALYLYLYKEVLKGSTIIIKNGDNEKKLDLIEVASDI